MLSSLSKFLKPPEFTDENQNATASILNAVLITLAFCLIIIAFLLYFFIPSSRDSLSLLGWTFIAAIIIKAFLQLRYLRSAAILCVALSWLLVTAGISTGFGVYEPATSAYVVVILLAGMLLNRWSAIYTAVIIVLTNVFVAYFMLNGAIAMPEAPLYPPQQIVIIYLISFFIGAILIFTVRGNIENAINRKLKTEQELIKTLQIAEKSEKQFRLISSVTSDYTFSSRIYGENNIEHISLSGAFETITGYSPDEFQKVGGWRATLHPDDIAQDDLDIAALQKNQQIVSELRIIKKNGEVRWIRVYANPIWDSEQNKLIGINGGVQDITERKRAEQVQAILFDISRARTETDDLYELLKFIHEKLQTLLEASNFYVALYDPKTKLYSFPYGVDEKDTDWEPSPLKNSLSDYVRRTGEPIIITGEKQDQLAKELGADLIGSWSEVWIGAPLKTLHGIIGVIAIQDYQSSTTYSQEDLDLLTYISENIAWTIESKRNEEALTQERNLLRTIVDTIPNAFYIKDTESRYLLTNDITLKLFGLDTPDQLLGHTAKNILINSNISYLDEEKHIFETGQSAINYEKLVKNPKTGKQHWMRSTKVPFYNNDGEIAGLVGIGQDITEEKEAKRQYIELELQREKVSFYRDFIGNMTHDLKSPVSSIKTASYVLARTDDPLKHEEQLERLNLQVNRLEKMIEDILIVARLDYFPELKFEKISLNSFLQAIERQLQAKAQQKNITIQFDLLPDSPSIHAAQDELLRALLNLLENAINYTPEAGNIVFRSYLQEQWVICEIQDTGIGIAEADLPHIFDQFFRASNARQFEAGTGLGLAIVKKIVNLHDGEIEVSSVIGEGTIFHLRLPCA